MESDALLIVLVVFLILGWMLAAAGWTAYLVSRGGVRIRATHHPADSAENRARDHVRQLEKRTVQEVADQLQEEARRLGQKHSRRELEQEARRLLVQAGTGRAL